MTTLARAKLIDALLLNLLVGFVVQVFVSITISSPYFEPTTTISFGFCDIRVVVLPVLSLKISTAAGAPFSLIIVV
jgi:hypothetical protein